MQRLTLGDYASSRLPAALGVTTSDPRWLGWFNEAQQRLLTKGLWWGCVGKFNLAAYDGAITLPPSLAAIETAALGRVPIPIRDYWFEFLTFGFGTRTAAIAGANASSYYGFGINGSGWPELVARGLFPVFRDIQQNANAHNLIVVCDLAADITAMSNITVTLTGWDANNNWIRTQVGGSYVDGEVVNLAQSPGTTTVNTFSRIAAVNFSGSRSGQAWLYDYDNTLLTSTMIGRYEWWETNPSYQRYFLPSMGVPAAGLTPPPAWQQDFRRQDLPDPAAGFNPCLLEVMAKLDYRPALNNSDYAIIQSIPAMKFMCQAIKKEEDGVSGNDLTEALGFEAKAMAELDDQLDHYLGSGRRIGMNVVGSDVTDVPIENFI